MLKLQWVGRPREVNLPRVDDAFLHLASTGGQWQTLPKDFPPASTVRRYFYGWRDGALAPDPRAWELVGYEAWPAAGSI